VNAVTSDSGERSSEIVQLCGYAKIQKKLTRKEKCCDTGIIVVSEMVTSVSELPQ